MIEVDNNEDLNKELSKNNRLIVLFYASWCPYCRSFVPVFKRLVTPTVGTVVHVLLDDYDNPLWDDYSIEAVPTVIFFENGKIMRRLDGRFGVGLNEKQLRSWLQEFSYARS